MDLRETGCEDGRWMELAQDCVSGVEPSGFLPKVIWISDAKRLECLVFSANFYVLERDK
jgi:hypothetical protein